MLIEFVPHGLRSVGYRLKRACFTQRLTLLGDCFGRVFGGPRDLLAQLTGAFA